MKQNIVKSQENLVLIDKKIELDTESIKKTNNIVEFIDPTYKKKNSSQSIIENNSIKKQVPTMRKGKFKFFLTITLYFLSLQFNLKFKNKDYIYEVKPENLDNFENDTEIFLPVQGQKRMNGTVKSIKKNKKTQSQCLHQ